MLVIKRIKTTYTLAGVAVDDRETVARVLEFHADFCPVARSIGGCIDITTEVEYV
ncbi:MAG: hypothetical protein HKN07_07010 [Acidimicrobiia bacterium]|nr:hypothetical protein [Acidimicrobiia bacterium]NNF63994.1 hypothetical protein [Acidimicrobiia bacterium]